ncbi:MAG: hypothetical protein GX297_04175 [Treponema sp.]|jgi:hypothetical protein|nr:hypothetical protein [Treponema sp.]
MIEPVDVLEEITKRYGTIKRARGCFLYTQSGTRITDLWLDNGRAILGWGAGNARMYFKNSINRGFTAVWGTNIPKKLERTLRAIFNDFAFFAFYTDKAKVDKAFLCSNMVNHKKIPVYLPWLNYGIDDNSLSESKIKKEFLSNKETCVEIVLPFSWQPATLLAFRNSELQPKIPLSDSMPAPLCEAFCRSLYDLRLELPRRTAEDWALFDKDFAPYWHRTGPYLSYKGEKENYHDFFIHCLEQKLLIAPSYDMFSIVPYDVNEGVFSFLRKNPFCKLLS